MAEIISVPFTVLWDSGVTESYDPDQGGTATVKFRCLWTDHLRLVQDLVGTRLISTPPPPGEAGSGITSIFPYRYPGSPNLYARSVTVEPLKGSAYQPGWYPLASWLVAKEVIVTCQFGFPKFFSPESQQSDASGKPYTQTSLKIDSEVVTIPNGFLFFPDGTPTFTPFAIFPPQIQISQKRYMLPYLPVYEILTVLSQVNQDVFPLGNFLCDVGTVLFAGADSDVTVNTDGTVLQTVGYNFIYKARGWNNALDPRTLQWTPVTDRSGQYTPYQPGDFSILP